MDEPATVIVQLIRAGREASEVMAFMGQKDAEFDALVAAAGRNGPCPCGSGLKAKRCHGAGGAPPEPADLSHIPLGEPRAPVSGRA
jgi:hypothetical protein